MTTPALPDQLQAQNVLASLGDIISSAERGTGLRVTLINVEFVHAVLRSVGGSLPAFWILPKELLSGETSELNSQKIAFTLKRREASAARESFGEDLAQAVQAVRAGLQALAPLGADFVTAARIEFRFELSIEGKISFFVKAGGKSGDAHLLALELAPHVSTP
ncbi:hypothetical protein [Deinococcus sp.]|uniref:hypothetical protein n=1 Tax=Deinococcus sp. TaxID=47478 RepID=UPI003CC6A19D